MPVLLADNYNTKWLALAGEIEMAPDVRELGSVEITLMGRLAFARSAADKLARA